MGGHRYDRLDRDIDEVESDRFAWVVLGLVALSSLIGLALIATNNWPT